MKLVRVIPYIALPAAAAAVIATDPTSWVLIPVAAVLAATVAFDIIRSREKRKEA